VGESSNTIPLFFCLNSMMGIKLFYMIERKYNTPENYYAVVTDWDTTEHDGTVEEQIERIRQLPNFREIPTMLLDDQLDVAREKNWHQIQWDKYTTM